jgi:hypothetical protein
MKKKKQTWRGWGPEKSGEATKNFHGHMVNEKSNNLHSCTPFLTGEATAAV